jgi:hypothetical protein
MEKENIYDKNYRLDLIEGIKNPRLKKLYQKWGINDTTYLLHNICQMYLEMMEFFIIL